MKTKLGKQETQFLAYVQMRKLRTVQTGDLTGPLKLTPDQERELFRRMARGGLIVRVRPGLYLVPPRLPLGGSWSPDEYLALNTLMADQKATYQICGLNAFNRYGFDDQIPARIYAYNNRISGERTIGSMVFTLIEVGDKRLGATEKIKIPNGETVYYSSRVRTLMDAVYDWSRFNSLPRAYDWIRKDLASKNITAEQLVSVTLRYGNLATMRRIGALLDKEKVPESVLKKLERKLTPTTSLIPWIPTLPKRGKVLKRWGIVWNEQG